MTSLRDWASTLLDRYAADLSPELIAQQRRLLELGEHALVAQDALTVGLQRHDLSSVDLDTASGFALAGAFGKLSPWFAEQIQQELSRP
ncbi:MULTISPECIES: hypothetical protein [Mycolicibacterium]|uniref:hypothetical protein n=1 Tax=Mycolicibacterium TaxID=1866885 RepID=UPI0007ED33B5|nr:MULTISPECIES: hypothetical protein [Mycolicibacterium]NOP96379.1 hypothetical protein [Mycolicibacterium fortuitum]OBK10164.1 hypothetical protein A5637_27560 [Mycolicibacterium fortuitum]